MKSELLRDFPWKWAFWWVLVPNIAFIAMWPIGGPSMAGPMFFCGCLAVLMSNEPKPVRMILAAVIMVIGVLSYLSKSFNLGVGTLTQSLQFVVALNPAESPEYIAAGLLVTACIVLLVTRGTRMPGLSSRDQKLVAVGLVALLINFDTIATAGVRGSYKMSAPSGAPIDSAILRNQLDVPDLTSRNLVVILVESWGQPNNSADRQVFDTIWKPERWSAKYDVSTGTSNYYGSTTNAELREWCGVWADFKSFDFDNADCVPKRFADAGFDTYALHSFDGVFFDREEWYPKLGFQHELFAAELKDHGASSCPGVFAGVCDPDVPKIIGNLLRQDAQKLKLVYWLTVNGHLPIPADDTLKTGKCDLGSKEWAADYPLLCRSYEIQRQLSDSITDEIMSPEFPDADILIVGDHMPPFFPRYLRTRFDSGKVPWIMLRRRPTEGQAQLATDT